MVGTARFELATPCTPSKCATRLRYVPTEFAAQNKDDDDSVGFDPRILHQSAASSEKVRRTIWKGSSVTNERDDYPAGGWRPAFATMSMSAISTVRTNGRCNILKEAAMKKPAR
jgi:hypothetical protein